jgi:hypothetical protein
MASDSTKYNQATTLEYTATVEDEAPTLISVSTTTEETAPILKISDEVASTTIDVSKIDQLRLENLQPNMKERINRQRMQILPR